MSGEWRPGPGVGRDPQGIGLPVVDRVAVNDPWEHRTQRMRCSTCLWFARKGETALGRCRRHAPTISGYPVVYGALDWCGDHKLNEVVAG